MSTYKLKKWFLLVLQALVILIILVAATATACEPQCSDLMIENMLHGIVAGMLFGTVKAIVRLSSIEVVCQSIWCWWLLARCVWEHELLAGFIGGWLFG